VFLYGVHNKKELVMEIRKNPNAGPYPYWAFIWPGAFKLTDLISQLDFTGKTVFEIGSASGICGIAAALCGATKVLLSDYLPIGVRYELVNADLNKVPRSVLDARVVDWNDIDNEELIRQLREYDIIIASDILYEKGVAKPLARFLYRIMKPGATGIIADTATSGYSFIAKFIKHLEAVGQEQQEGVLLVKSHGPLKCFTGNRSHIQMYFVEVTKPGAEITFPNASKAIEDFVKACQQ